MTARKPRLPTQGLVPILGALELGSDQGDADAVKINMVFASGHVDVFTQGTNNRRWWVVGAEIPPHNSPGQHTRYLFPTPRTQDTTAELHAEPWASNWYALKDEQGRLRFTGTRHAGHRRALGRWLCIEYRYDIAGGEWTRELIAVTDDFGWLVEVPAC